MKVYDHIDKINIFGDVHVADLKKFFSGHEPRTDVYVEYPDSCSCGYEYRDWPEHVTEEFIAWITNL